MATKGFDVSVWQGNIDFGKVKASGIEIKKLFNTSGMLYKSLNLKEKLPTMTDEEKFDLLATDGMLVKRPIAVSENTVLVGFNADKWSALK